MVQVQIKIAAGNKRSALTSVSDGTEPQFQIRAVLSTWCDDGDEARGDEVAVVHCT